jgi:hypothetical protein
MAETARQYLSHILRNLGWPPRSHNFIVTLPFVTFLMLNPTCRKKEVTKMSIGLTSSWYKKKLQFDWKLLRYNFPRNGMTIFEIMAYCWDHVFAISTSLESTSQKQKYSHQHQNQSRREAYKIYITTLTRTFTYSDNIYKRSFPSILKSYKRQLHFLLEKETINTLEKTG